MKRVFIALVLLAVIAGAGVYALCRLSAVRDCLSAELDEIERMTQTAGEEERCLAANEFYQQVINRTGWMRWWFHQDHINELVQDSLLLEVYAKDGCSEDFLAQVAQCRQALDHLWLAEYPSPRSIF